MSLSTKATLDPWIPMNGSTAAQGL